MSETPTTTTSQKSIAIHLQFVSQYASNLYCSGFGAPTLWGKGNTVSSPPPFVSQYAPHLYCNTLPICIAVLLGKSWWLWSPGCSPNQVRWRISSSQLNFQEWPRQTKPKKGQFMNFSQGAFRNKSSICESCLFSQGKTPEFRKMGEIHELFVLALSLVWFAGATPEIFKILELWMSCPP